MQSTEFKQIFQQHIKPHLQPSDLINLIQVSHHLSTFITLKNCIKCITTKIKQALKEMLKQNYDWFIQIMQDHNMLISGSFIFDCVSGNGEIRDRGVCVILDCMTNELREKLNKKNYKYDSNLEIILQPNSISESLIDVSFDRNIKNLHELDIHKNYWSPSKLYFHKLFDVCSKEISYELLNPYDVRKYNELGFKFTKNRKVMTDADIKNELLQYFDIEYYNKCDHKADSRIQEYLKKDAWYQLKEPIVWSCGDKYIVKRSTFVYKNVINLVDHAIIPCGAKCLARLIFPDILHFNHSQSHDPREKHKLIIVNDLV